MTHPDATIGQSYRRAGLRISRSDIEPTRYQRVAAWAEKFFAIPAHDRAGPIRCNLPKSEFDSIMKAVKAANRKART